MNKRSYVLREAKVMGTDEAGTMRVQVACTDSTHTDLRALAERMYAYLDTTLHGRRPPENPIELAAAIRAALAKNPR